MRNLSPNTTLALTAIHFAVQSASAAERVTLANGFVEVCDHHSAINGRIRLFPSAAEDSYIDLLASDVVSLEPLPQPPAQPATPVPAINLTKADISEVLAHAGKDHNLDVDLLSSVIKAESNGNAHAVSRAGAQGLMQLMPQTAASLGVHDSFSPGENVQGGSAYLDALLKRYHDNLALALAAYNAGPEAVDKYHGIPPYAETRAYVARVIHEFNRRILLRQSQRSTSGK